MRHLKRKEGKIKESVSSFFLEKGHYVIFLSATDRKERAIVVHARARTFEESWKQAVQQLKKKLLFEKMKPIWIKADLVTDIETYSYQTFMTNLTQTKPDDFFAGISFDRLFRFAFLEQEVYVNGFFNQRGDEEAELALFRIQTYLKENKQFNLEMNFNNLTDIYTFHTVSVFHDESTSYDVSNHQKHHGHREIDLANAQDIYGIINHSAHALAGKMKASGYFDYVHDPTLKQTPHVYSMGQHALSISALLAAYEVTNDETLKRSIHLGMQSIIKHSIIRLQINGQTYAFVKENEQLIDLYASAQTLLAFVKYKQVFGSWDNETVVEQLMRGLLYFQQENGSFAHALYEDGTLKDSHVHVFYDGAVLLALVRYLQIAPNQSLFHQIEEGFQSIMEQEAWKRGDYLLNHAAIEFFYQHPQLDYAKLVLKGTKHQLNNAFTHDTSVGVLIEYFVPTYFFIQVLQQHEILLDVFSEGDVRKLKILIQHRAKQQLHAYVWPEVAMYFSKPMSVVHHFYIREDSYRIQLNDLATNLSSYYYYLAFLQELKKTASLDSFSRDLESVKEAELLLLVSPFKKQDESRKALAYFEAFIVDNQKYMDITYTNYARHLRLSGNINRAKKILGNGITHYPASEMLLYEFLKLSLAQNDYSSIITISGDLIKVNPNEANYYFELGRALSHIGETDKAKSAFRIGLIRVHHMSTEQLIKKIQQSITSDSAEISSLYTFLGGKNNLGVILHTFGEKEYFTKITRQDEDSLRERLFNERVMSTYQQLEEIAPTFITAESLDQLQYITVEKIGNIKKGITIEEVLTIVEQITSVGYKEIVDKYPNPNYKFQINHQIGQSSVYFFTRIHEKQQNEDLFAALYKYAEEFSLGEIIPIISRMETIIMRNHLYDEIIPETHYTLLHGDFKLENMSVNNDGQLKVLDWGQFTIGPHFIDLALFFSTIRPKFSKIVEKYLENMDLKRVLSIPEKLYFSLALIINYLIVTTPKNQQYLLDNFILPVLSYMEEQEKLLGEHTV